MKKQQKQKVFLSLGALFTTTIGFAGSPLVSITPLIPAPSHLAHNASSYAVYKVINNTRTLRSFKMKPIQGITQITTTTGACSNPISLQFQQSCLLNLRIAGNQLAAQTNGGPIICNNQSNPFACSQPSSQNSLNITQTPDELSVGNTWISVLIAQDEPPADLKTYVQQIHNLAPAAEQVHVRLVPIQNPTVGPTSNPTYYTIYQEYADLIADLRTAYATNPAFLVGFHPDNSKGSESYWGCANGDWQCVLNYSIIVMNNINAIADPNKTGQGFNIYSIEQSYLEPVDPTNLQNVKACLNPPDAAPGAVCPVATIASPVVSYGDVLPSYGDSTIYGSDKLDYGYPQYYNLVESVTAQNGPILITSSPNSYFPPDSAANCINGAAYPYNIIDANLSGKPITPTTTPLIPCFTLNVQAAPYPNPANDVFTYNNMADPTLAAAYDAYLMTQLPPISETVNTNGATVYITFSGEPEFLGATGWTLDLINQFNQKLNQNFTTLNTLIPGIVPPGVDTSKIKYAIWNYTAILANE